MPRAHLHKGGIELPRNNGIFTLPPSYRAVSGQTIRTEQHNPPLEDIEQALTDSLPRDGTAPMTGNLPMNSRRITNLGAATASSDAARLDQVTPYSAWLASVSALAMAANQMVYATGASTAAKTTLTAFARTLLDDANAGAARDTLGITASDAIITRLNAAVDHTNSQWQDTSRTAGGLPSPQQVGLAISANTSVLKTANNLSDVPSKSTARANLDVPPNSRRFSAGDGLDGGGDFNSDRTFAVDGTVFRTSGNQSVSGLKLFSGSVILNALTLGGDATAAGFQITNLPAPSVNTSAARKAYVDGQDIGIGQSWQNVTGSRAHSTIYTNATTSPIQVAIRGNGDVDVQVSVTGSGGWVPVATLPNTSRQTSPFIVPPGHSYRVNGTSTIDYWSELR